MYFGLILFTGFFAWDAHVQLVNEFLAVLGLRAKLDASSLWQQN